MYDAFPTPPPPGGPLEQFTPHPEEHPDVTAFRAFMAREVRDWARCYVEAPAVDDMTFAARLSLFQFALVRQMAKISIDLEQGTPPPDSFALRRPKRRYPVTGAVSRHRTAPTA